MKKRKLVIPNDIKISLKEVGVKKGQAFIGRNQKNGGPLYVKIYLLMTNGLHQQIQWELYQKCSGSGRGYLEVITLQGQ